MPERNNMGRKSHHAQDADYDQNMNRLADDIKDQPTRPTLGKVQSTKSSKEEPRPTK
jgi:hypothetical protein